MTAAAKWQHLQGRFMMGWSVGLAAYLAGFAFAFAKLPRPGQPPAADPAAQAAAVGQLYLLLIGLGIVVGFAMLAYLAALQRELWGSLRIGPLRAAINLRAGGLLRFWLVNLALIVFTLGLGLIMMPYRVFGFYARRVRLTGIIDVEMLQQTSLDAPRQGDGLADAFDIAAF